MSPPTKKKNIPSGNAAEAMAHFLFGDLTLCKKFFSDHHFLIIKPAFFQERNQVWLQSKPL